MVKRQVESPERRWLTVPNMRTSSWKTYASSRFDVFNLSRMWSQKTSVAWRGLLYDWRSWRACCVHQKLLTLRHSPSKSVTSLHLTNCRVFLLLFVCVINNNKQTHCHISSLNQLSCFFVLCAGCWQLVFVSLFSDNTNARLRSLAVDFVHHLCLKLALLLVTPVALLLLLPYFSAALGTCSTCSVCTSLLWITGCAVAPALC